MIGLSKNDLIYDQKKQKVWPLKAVEPSCIITLTILHEISLIIKKFAKKSTAFRKTSKKKGRLIFALKIFSPGVEKDVFNQKMPIKIFC